MNLQINSLSQNPILTIDNFLRFNEEIFNLDLQEILNLNFDVFIKKDSQKICPILQIAEPNDADEIFKLFKDVYAGTYPYKKMENIEELLNMIKDPHHLWFLIKKNSNETIGCFGAELKLKTKKAYLYGLVVKPEYQRIINTIKVFVGTWIYLCKSYKKDILIYHGEARTNDTASQYGPSIFGMKPIAFLPNKDIFFNRVESTVMIIAYYENTLRKLRRRNPRIIRQILNSYMYINNRYNLGVPDIENPNINLDQLKVRTIKNNIKVKIEENRYGNKAFNYNIKNTDSYFKFIYNPYSNNIEKTKFIVQNLEELQAFIHQVIILIHKLKVQYFECFVSAYEPGYQKVFYNSGFMPIGYIPCWKYDKNQNIFEDQIIFNYFKGNIDKNIKLTPETEELLKSLNLLYFNDKLNEILFKSFEKNIE